MKVYAPQVSVKLIKASPRKDLVEGLQVSSERYGELRAIDLTPYLGEDGSVQTRKSIRECTGGFSITLTDRAHAIKGGLETIYALVEPMDLVEIRFCRDPSAYGADKMPVVMRGFVSEVGRTESMSGGRPQRSVQISGHDFGKILQIIQIFYLNNAAVGDNLLSQMAFFHKYADEGDAKIKPANDFLKEVVEQVVNPYLKDLVSLANGESVGAKTVNEWSVAASVEGTVSPYAISSVANSSLEMMLTSLLDVGPFNELYVEDLADAVQLVLRPAPFLDVKGAPIQGVKPESVEAGIEEVVSSAITRTDAGVANYYWVTDSRWTMMNNEDAQLLAQQGDAKNYLLFDYVNSQSRLYGIRKMEVGTLLGPADFSQSDAVQGEELPDQVNTLGGWLDKRRKILADANKDNILFEHGSFTMQGHEKFKAGRQLMLKRGGRVWSYYVTSVDHEFRPLGGFTSKLIVERGTNFIERSQAAAPLYVPEMAGGPA